MGITLQSLVMMKFHRGFLLAAVGVLLANSAEASGQRKQRNLFETSTVFSTTTSTFLLQTDSLCYTTATGVTAGCKKRKRSIDVSSDFDVEYENLRPSQIRKDIEPTKDELLGSGRAPRFFPFIPQVTSTLEDTSVTTSTLYTGTIVLSVSCIPSSV